MYFFVHCISFYSELQIIYDKEKIVAPTFCSTNKNNYVSCPCFFTRAYTLSVLIFGYTCFLIFANFVDLQKSNTKLN